MFLPFHAFLSPTQNSMQLFQFQSQRYIVGRETVLVLSPDNGASTPPPVAHYIMHCFDVVRPILVLLMMY